ncbi:MAG: fumarylacetoacetate hydrolase family protein [Acetobacteraceae bacterium]|nr:fumarylacetoacetate hydrolase family protein [Acetobacteraceae bacterium]
MALWVRFAPDGFGTLEGDVIAVHRGDMLGGCEATGERLPLDSVRLLAPVTPSKMIGLWNNFHALAAKLGQATPAEPLYFIKGASCYGGPETTVRRPPGYDGKVVYEGELGIVIGTRCQRASEAEAGRAVFGFTCINDITAADILNRDPSFAQWTRAKSFDGFGLMGPAVATGLRPETLVVRTILNGVERQNYPVADMVFPVERLVSLLSHDMTLEPGDVICCGTSVGVGVMKEATNTVEIVIDGIGALRATYLNG